MVFYTCSGCGESLKKNKVENHCYQCRGCEYLTCIDCNTDFYGDDYRKHTSCITENEKYSAKGTEFKANKGDVKQQQWLQNVESVMSSGKNLSKKARDLIDNLKNYDNIPRKRAKFLNFVRNSLRIYDNSLGEEVWEALSSANSKPVTKTATDNVSVAEENGSTDQLSSNCEVEPIKSSKTDKKAKKKRKNKLEDNNHEAVTDNSNVLQTTPTEDSQSGKKTKKLKKKKKVEKEELRTNDSEHDCKTEVAAKKKSKKRKKDLQENLVANKTDTDDAPKKKKKKLK